MAGLRQSDSPRTRTKSTVTSSMHTTPSKGLTASKSSSNLRARSPLKPSSPAVRRTGAVSPSKPPARKPPAEIEHEDQAPIKSALSIREQIALKRAETKKTTARIQASSSGGDQADDDWNDSFGQKSPAKEEEPDLLGRWTVRETIERARSSGSLSLASRDLKCLPSALYEIHLGVTPEPLQLVPDEPPLPPAEENRRRGGANSAPAWFEATDLQIIQAGNNEILEIQPEISLFGSLKSIDFHNNKLTSLPDTLADLPFLTFLDLSHNSLESLPPLLFALPALVNLNLSHNRLRSAPFSTPFISPTSAVRASKSRDAGASGFFAPTITRAKEPLPKLQTLNLSHNQIPASLVSHDHFPSALRTLDLSSNPLGDVSEILRSASALLSLRVLRMAHAELATSAFKASLLQTPRTSKAFSSLHTLDVGETSITQEAVHATLESHVAQTLSFDITTEEPPTGTLQIIVGKKVVKEPWEIEAERRVNARTRDAGSGGSSQVAQLQDNGPDVTFAPPQNAPREPKSRKEVQKEAWEMDEEMMSAGARRRLRAAQANAVAAAAATTTITTAATTKPAASASPSATAVPPRRGPATKEAWEIEAEEGMMSAGARRRARAAAAGASSTPIASVPVETPDSPSASGSPTSTGALIASSNYYDSKARVLTLPPVQPLAHSRAFSLASRAVPGGAPDKDAFLLPSATLPLALIAAQPLSSTLRTLILSNRRMDQSVVLPVGAGLEGADVFLPELEELTLEGCRLAPSVRVVRPTAEGGADPETKEDLLPLLSRLFPSLRTLDLTANAINSAALTLPVLRALCFSSLASGSSIAPKGLRHLRLRENRLDNLDGFVELARLFKGNRELDGWTLEELDVRENAVNKLDVELGLLPLEVFLVAGNTFRMPPSRVWDREGTKGLLSWLRGRME